VCEDCTRILELAPKISAAWRLRAMQYWRHLKDFDASLDDWREMVRLSPADLEPWYCIGVIHFGRREHEPALAALDKAILLRPTYEEAIRIRAFTAFWTGKFENALKGLDPVVTKLTKAPADLAKAPKQNGQALYAAACVWSLASRAAPMPERAQHAADRAAELLTQALDKGFHDFDFAEYNRVSDDPALFPSA
jgi:tetratricopeptide (TPR) repeat protein